MEFRLCGHPRTHKPGKARKGNRRYFGLQCQPMFNERFAPLSYHRHVSEEQIWQVLQVHSKGNSLRGISRTTELAYHKVVSIVVGLSGSSIGT